MGRTRERLCCAGVWLSRLDMNTYQTSIKASILLMYLCLHHEYQRNETPQWFTTELNLRGVVCVCVFSSHLFWTSSSLDVPAWVTQDEAHSGGRSQEEGHTGFLIHLPSAVQAFIFFARRIQPFLSLVDREVEFRVLTVGHFFFFFLSEEKSQLPGLELTSQRVRRLRGY